MGMWEERRKNRTTSESLLRVLNKISLGRVDFGTQHGGNVLSDFGRKYEVLRRRNFDGVSPETIEAIRQGAIDLGIGCQEDVSMAELPDIQRRVTVVSIAG